MKIININRKCENVITKTEYPSKNGMNGKKRVSVFVTQKQKTTSFRSHIPNMV